MAQLLCQFGHTNCNVLGHYSALMYAPPVKAKLTFSGYAREGFQTIATGCALLGRAVNMVLFAAWLVCIGNPLKSLRIIWVDAWKWSRDLAKVEKSILDVSGEAGNGTGRERPMAAGHIRKSGG